MAVESRLEKECKQHALSLGFICRKLTSPANPGIMDRLFVGPKGDTLYVEFKRPGEKPTEKQMAEMNRFRTNKAPTVWVDNSVKFKSVIQDFLRSPKTVNDLYPL